MARNPISNKVKIRHSQSGKLDVVKGAISDRLTLEETFVRRFKTLKSYGTLVTLVYSDEVARIFPKPQAHGALPFEHANDGPRLKVIEWALPKVSDTQIQAQNSTDSSETSGDDCPRRASSRHRQRRL
jgi:hypothetical protein